MLLLIAGFQDASSLNVSSLLNTLRTLTLSIDSLIVLLVVYVD